jgi:putative ABC transport system permease protein
MMEVRPALRLPASRLAVALAIAIGTGAVVAVFSVVYPLLLRPLPFPHSERLISVTMRQPQQGIMGGRVSYPDFRDWRESGLFERLAAVSQEQLVLTGGAVVERLSGARTTADFFPVFGLPPILGAIPREEWESPGARLAILSHALWITRFGGDPHVLGRAVTLDDEPYTVAAVMPPQLDFPPRVAVWLPLDVRSPDSGAEVRAGRFLEVVGRLRPGVRVEEASRRMREVSARLAAEYPETNRGFVAELLPLHEQLVGDLRPGLLVLSAAVALVLMILCANAAGILIARGMARSGEIWLRLALGAKRWQIARLLLVEGAVVALIGGGLGVLLGRFTSRVFLALYPRQLATEATRSPGWMLPLFGLAVALVVGLIICLPAVAQAVRQGAASARGETSPGLNRVALRTQSVLVVLQLAVSLALLVAAGLMLGSFHRLTNVDPGFRSDNVLTARLMLPTSRYSQPYEYAAFFSQVLDRLAGLPGIRSAAGVTNLPLSGSNMQFGFTLLDGVQHPAGVPLRAGYRAVSPGYFRTLGVPLLAGREVEPRDTDKALPVVVVNRSFARRFFPDGRALGRRIQVMYGNISARQIIGVVGDLRHAGLVAPPEPEMYVPFEQNPWPFMTLVVRTAGDPGAAVPALRSVVSGLDPGLPVDRISTMQDVVSESVSRPRFLGSLLAAFALLAIATAAFGIYGLASHWVTLRFREIGVHMALGASPQRVRGIFFRRSLGLALSGTLIGVVLALMLGRILAGMLFGVSPGDPVTLLLTAAGLMLIVVTATWLPARRASRVDPVVVLRHE